VVDQNVHDRLTAWIGEQLDGADEVRLHGWDRMELGHSAEMLSFTIRWQVGGAAQAQDVVLKLRPPSPGLLEPYDLARQFTILRALEPTDVRTPRALWLEPSGDVLGREFYVMERMPGEAYERVVPPELDADPERIPRMCDGLIDQLVAVHSVDLKATGLDQLGDPATYADRELGRWAGDLRDPLRVGQLQPVPQLAAHGHVGVPAARQVDLKARPGG
jgi:aminoglycoside phosphotransferase (APT) family kinase protein